MPEPLDPFEAMAAANEALVQFDGEAAVAHLSTALRGFTQAGDDRMAAIACAGLGDVYANALGNLSAARAWFARADRLAATLPPCLEQGWVAVAPMGCEVGDPAELLTRAELAISLARRFGDVNLETKGLADAGLAKVQSGQVSEGFALLDEAMALACGTADDEQTAAKSVCSFFTACYYSADFERAAAWAELLRKQGLLGTAPGGQIFLSNHCDMLQATSLCELGRWSDAESLLTSAIAAFESAMGMPSYHASVALADLRIRQGRLAEAEALLIGKDQTFEALLPMARLAASRGDIRLVRSAVGRALACFVDDKLRAADALTTLALAEIAAGDLDAARRAADELAERARGLAIPALDARVASVGARASAAEGDLQGAIRLLEEVLPVVDPVRMPWCRANLLLELASLRVGAGEAAEAEVDIRAAESIIEGLDVVLRADQIALLERRAGITTPPSNGAVLVRDGRWWSATHGGVTIRLTDTKGLRYLSVLLSAPGVERHALDLVDAVEGIDPSRAIDRRALGSSSPAIDGQARRAYRARIEELRTDVEEAFERGDLDAAELRQAELDALVSELARAFGIGGAPRPTGTAPEKARLNVTRALRAATTKISSGLPEAGWALDADLRTGLYCAYEPSAGGISWIVQGDLNGPAQN